MATKYQYQTSVLKDKDKPSIGSKLLTNMETQNRTNRQTDRDRQQNEENICKVTQS